MIALSIVGFSNGGGMFASRCRPIVVAIVLFITLSLSLSLSRASTSPSTPSKKAKQRPNIVFLIDESTDGRTYRPSFEAIDLINIRRLFASPVSASKNSDTTKTSPPPKTVQFDTHYVTAPVCAASRASIWSGKYPHKIPHLQAHTRMKVNGVWNNFEGLPHDYNDKIHNVLDRIGYDIKISGKTDWVTGGHSLDNRLSAWTMYTNFPYNATDQQAGFFNSYGMCTGNGTIHPNPHPHRGGYYSNDWKALNETTAWIADRGMEQAISLEKGEPFTPFFAYQGMNIVHPAYFTSSYWYERVNHSAVTAPVWKKLQDLHPCDYQATMLKGCLPENSSEASSVYSLERRKRIRAIYYAMILEFDSMVGAYLDALESISGLADNTVVILTSDHGDMQMEHQQFYKHVAYDASSRVPLIIKIPANPETNRNEKTKDGHGTSPASASDYNEIEAGQFVVNPFVRQPTSHVDLFPTIMDLAGVPQSLRPTDLHGESLLPFLAGSPSLTATTIGTESAEKSSSSSLSSSRLLQNATKERGATSLPQTAHTIVVPRKRPFVVNQFHGCDIAMSWFSIVDENHYKYTVFGTGHQHEPQLFDLKDDPDETTNLATDPNYEHVISRLDDLLLSVVKYKEVAEDVARYTHSSLGAWVNATSDWKTIVQNLRWSASFDQDANASIRAMEAYLEGPPMVYECRSEPVWPPPEAKAGG